MTRKYLSQRDDEFDFSRLVGTKRADTFNGSIGNDTYKGLGGNDKIDGRGGNDKLYGGDGNDDVRGGDDNDKLWGDNGQDLLYGGTGNDTLTGGRGSDTFLVVTTIETAGIDTITDFKTRGREMDRVSLEYTWFDDWAEIEDALTDERGNAVLQLDDTSALIFKGISSSELSAKHFIVLDMGL